MFEELTQRIEALQQTTSPVVVAISGYGGSGKSFLANKLCEYFGVAENQVVHIDHLYSKNHEEAVGMFDTYDWPLITSLLRGIHTNARLQYASRGYRNEVADVNEPMPTVLIFEGVRALRPEIMPYIDEAVWIDCPPALATERAKARDRSQGENEAEIARWETEWTPENDRYVEAVNPEKLATFIYREYK